MIRKGARYKLREGICSNKMESLKKKGGDQQINKEIPAILFLSNLKQLFMSNCCGFISALLQKLKNHCINSFENVFQ
jgi:hypothetical protein